MNFFEQFGEEAHKLEEKFLGPDYNYAKNILSPKDLEMIEFDGKNFDLINNNGLPELAADFAGLIDYVELLVSGTSNASKTGKPLGNRYFLPTAGTCKDSDGNEQVRNIYVNNIPTGSIPIISAIAGKDFSEFRGLVPGIFTDLEVLNPLKLFSGMFVSPDTPCSNVELSVVDKDNNETFESKYVINQDIRDIDPCVFSNQVNTITQETCSEIQAFTNMNNNKNKKKLNIDDDKLIKIYFVMLTILYFYIFLRLICKK